MTCFKCGAKLKNGSSYCHVCGAKQASASAYEKPPVVAVAKRSPAPVKKSNTLRIVLICLAVLIVIIAVPTVLVLTNPAMDVGRALSDNDFATAAEIFGTKIKDDTVTQTAARTAVAVYVENQRRQYIDGEIDAATAVANITAIADMNVVDASVTNTALSYVQRLDISRTAWQAAETAFNGGDYKTAIVQYALVTDTNYAAAQQKLAEAQNTYRDAVLAEADTYLQQQNYGGAADIINAALAVMPDDARLNQKLQLITEGASAEALSAILGTADAQAAAGDYAGALITMSDVAAVYGADVSYQEKLTAIKDACRAAKLAEAEDAGKTHGPQAAIAVIDSALALLPEDEQLLAARETYAAIPSSSKPATSSSSSSEAQ